MRDQIAVSPEWEKIDRARLQGLVMVIGASNVGKTTFARWVLRAIGAERGESIGFLDGDPGQSKLGPPTTLTLALTKASEAEFPPSGRVWRWFVGSTTPRGRLLTHLVGTARLVESARTAGIHTTLLDTTGLIHPSHGGLALKQAKLSLLRPDIVVAIRRGDELEPLLKPVRQANPGNLIELSCSPLVRILDAAARKRHRESRLAKYFAGANPLQIDTSRYAVVPDNRLHRNQILALEDEEGFTLALAVVANPGSLAEILTPLSDLEGVVTLRLGDLAVDPKTGLGI